MNTFSVTGVVTRITSEGAFGGAIFRLRSKSTSKGVRVRASYCVMRDAPWLGEVLEAKGTYVDSAYGPQFEACQVIRGLPELDQIVTFVEHHPFFVGVGRAAISDLWRKEGSRLYQLLNDRRVDELTAKALTIRQAHVLVRGWTHYNADVEIGRHATEHELPQSVVRKAYEMWGHDAFARIAEDPYLLLLFSRWATVDRVATSLFNVDSNSHLRCRWACIKVLNDAAAQGELRLTQIEATKRISRLLGTGKLADKAIKESVRSGHVRKQNRVREATLQAQGASILEDSISDVLARRRVTRHIFEEGFALEERDEARSLQIVMFGERSGVWLNVKTPAMRRTIHLFSSDSISSRLGRGAAGQALLSVQEVLALGVEATQGFDIALVHDASTLSFSVTHGLLRRLERVMRVVFLCYAPCRLEPHFQANIIDSAQPSRGKQTLRRRNIPPHRWSKTTHEESNSDGLQCSMGGASGFTRLCVEVNDLRTGYDVACGQFRLCSSVGSSLFVTMSRRVGNLINRQFHVENLDARKYQSLPCPLAALSRQQFATIGDMVIWEGQDFGRRLFRGARGQVLDVLKRGYIEFDDEGRVRELAMTIRFDGVGDVKVGRDELSSLRLGYATSFLDAVQPRVEFAVVLLARTRFLSSDAVAMATSRSAAGTVVVGSANEMLAAGVIT
ncbi:MULTISPECIES: helix-hairpin-helix domain-containing protein [unclassified Caballeronia]|uniref:helix-hairpin-helix domain-containing protein n=1 Tax=unclassified Caballeronia TaxID=2646786 RepID=UPI0028581357|nr:MULTISPECIES: helix-hairpin-helix domain-containing protein [unclassified Caballeronia]MDR5751363.1 helix-hairpin-helix domain-containing protein [Caballeronia sp. LZ024]MDR5844495.1 helix-hairpin-helix domain-containing protein [Caballeronia sp. LZ031]